MGAVVVGLELKFKKDIKAVKQNMRTKGFDFQYLNEMPELYSQLIG